VTWTVAAFLGKAILECDLSMARVRPAGNWCQTYILNGIWTTLAIASGTLKLSVSPCEQYSDENQSFITSACLTFSPLETRVLEFLLAGSLIQNGFVHRRRHVQNI
jgi:hypothetical protein